MDEKEEDWEKALMAGMRPEERTPIYDALYLEYRAKFWHKVLGLNEVKETKD